MPHTILMLATSYPRFSGDTVGTFMEPIAHGIAARGHAVHMVLPWHPKVQRPSREGNVHFHFFRYAPHPSLNVFGYAEGLREDVALRGSAWLAAPLAVLSGLRLARTVARQVGATIMHGHWVVPGGVMASYAARDLPLVVSLHGSDVYVAERNPLIGRVANLVFFHASWVTACSEDLRDRAVALGARESRSEVIPYGVDTTRFAPDPGARSRMRATLGLPEDAEVVFSVGRFVRKKGLEYLVEATARLVAARPRLRLVLAGAGDLDAELRARAVAAGVADRLVFPGLVPHGDVASYLAAADVVAVPSVRDDSGNVDGLPNVVMEALASGTPLIATPAGGIGAVVEDEVTGRLVPERDPEALANAISRLLDAPDVAARLGERARRLVEERYGWDRVAERFEAVYDRAATLPR
jgi:glycosyltransferase involved in cell wall biosynthesis